MSLNDGNDETSPISVAGSVRLPGGCLLSASVLLCQICCQGSPYGDRSGLGSIRVRCMVRRESEAGEASE